MVSCTTSGTPTAQETAGPTSSAVAETSQPAPPAPAVASDEDQVKEAIKTFQDAYNTQNWDAYLEMLCPKRRAEFVGGVMDSLKKNRTDTGITTVDVVSVKITGDEAAAVIDGNNETTGTGRATMNLERGDDGWKICMKY